MHRHLAPKLASVISFAIGATSALAADLPAPAYTKAPPMVAEVYNWNGFYLGVQGGGGWGTSREFFGNAPNSPTQLFTQNYNISGGIAGGVAGYNWQANSWVFGVEADYNWSNISGRSGVINVGPPNLGDTYFTNVRSYGDVKGRVGWAADSNRLLVYVDGGVAFAQLNHHYDAALNGGAANTFIANASKTGWTAGIGLEYLLTRNRTGRVEFDWVGGLGTSTIFYGGAPTNFSNWKDSFGVVKAGLNYKFGGPIVAKN